MGLADDGVAVELQERLVEDRRGQIAVTGPQGADDPLVGIVVVEPCIRSYRQVRAP